VVHGETGLLIDDDRPESIARALETVLGDPEHGRAMGRAGRASAEARFSAERSVETVERVYQSIW
jgi:starch synthase